MQSSRMKSQANGSLRPSKLLASAPVSYTHLTLPPYVPAAIMLALTGWSALGLVVLLCSTSATTAAVSQYAFLTLTSVLSFVVPLCATHPSPTTPDRHGSPIVTDV